MPSFTAILPNYNDSARIDKALAGLLGQTHPFDEILIVDDGSTDDSIAVIEQLIDGRSNVRLLRHAKNQGVVATLNSGIDQCRTDFLLMCSANDTYSLQLVEWCNRALKQYPDAKMVAGNVRLSYAYISSGKKDVERLLPFPEHMQFYSPGELIAWQRRAPIHFNGGASMLSTLHVKQYGGLLSALEWHADWFVYNLLAFENGIVYVPKIFSVTMFETGSYSGNINIWEKQKPVIENTIKTLATRYPKHALLFRRAALLPGLHLRNPLILLHKDLIWFVTPLLFWRVITHRMFYWLKYFLPRPFMMRVRTWFRI